MQSFSNTVEAPAAGGLFTHVIPITVPSGYYLAGVLGVHAAGGRGYNIAAFYVYGSSQVRVEGRNNSASGAASTATAEVVVLFLPTVS